MSLQDGQCEECRWLRDNRLLDPLKRLHGRIRQCLGRKLTARMPAEPVRDHQQNGVVALAMSDPVLVGGARAC